MLFHRRVGTGADRPRPSAGQVQRPGARDGPEAGVSVERRGGDETSVGRGAQSQKCEEEAFVAYIPSLGCFVPAPNGWRWKLAQRSGAML